MEFFDYADWLADGRRKAKSAGHPDLDTERMYMHVYGNDVWIYYTVELKTTSFTDVVAKMDIDKFSARFFNMLTVEGQA